jgi:ABC-type nitrate/sulfonate/bicarbonate transport system ATPase subunit
MDEPFVGLDIKLKQIIINKFIELWNKDKKTVIFVTHNVDDALRLGNNIYMLSNHPLSVQQKLNINSNIYKRKLVDRDVNQVRASIYKTIEKWK